MSERKTHLLYFTVLLLILMFANPQGVLAGISDPAGNGVGNLPFTEGEAYEIDRDSPTVVSFDLITGTPTNVNSVKFVITFSEPVTGVSESDFSLTVTSLVGTSITSVVGSSDTYTVTVSTGTGDGTLALTIPETATIQDAVGNGLTGLPVSSEAYVVDRTAPDTSITAHPADPTNSGNATFWFTATDSGGAGVAYYECRLDSGNWEVCTSPLEYTGLSSGSHTFSVRAYDAAGNVDGTPASFTWTIDTEAPSVVSITRLGSSPTNANSVQFTVTFSKAVTGVGANDFSLFITGGITGASVSSVSGSGTTYTVTVNTGSGDGTIRLDIPASATIQDTAGNSVSNIPYSSGESYQIDKTAPTVVSIVRADPNPTRAQTVTFTVTFSEAVVGVTVDDFDLTTTGTITNAFVMSVSGNGTTYTVTVNTGTGSGTIRLDLISRSGNSGIRDLAGNSPASLPYTGGENYDVDRTEPTVVAITRLDSNPTSLAIIRFSVIFSEAVTGVSDSDFVLITSGVSGATITEVSGSNTTYTVSVNTGTGNGTIRLDIPASATISDLAGNSLAGLPYTSGEVYDVVKVILTTIYVKKDATGANNGTSWANAFTDLQAALAAATSGKEIWVAKGVYYPGSNVNSSFVLKEGVALYGGFAGNETERDQRNPLANPTVLSGDIDRNDVVTPEGITASVSNIVGRNAYHVVRGASLTESSTILDGFIITAGKADGTNSDRYGAGLHLTGSRNLILRNLTFIGNSADENGGGLYLQNSNLNLNSLSFEANYAFGRGGGAFVTSSQVSLSQMNFEENEAIFGGGLGAENSTVNLSEIIFQSNQARYGGGYFADNTATNITKTTFQYNQAMYNGGAVNLSGNNTTMVNVTFYGNQAGFGAGVYTIGYANATLTNLTFVENSAGMGGGIFNGKSILLRNSVFSRNQGGDCVNGNGASLNGQSKNNVMEKEGTEACGLANSVNSNKIVANAMLGYLDDHGGYTLTVAPLENSPVLEAGNTDSCPAVDQRGVSRPNPGGTVCDVGAFESELRPLTPTTPAPTTPAPTTPSPTTPSPTTPAPTTPSPTTPSPTTPAPTTPAPTTPVPTTPTPTTTPAPTTPAPTTPVPTTPAPTATPAPGGYQLFLPLIFR